MAVHVKNMTTGKPGKLILAFSLSLVAGNVFQQLYTVVDTMVVGKYLVVPPHRKWPLISPIQLFPY